MDPTHLLPHHGSKGVSRGGDARSRDLLPSSAISMPPLSCFVFIKIDNQATPEAAEQICSRAGHRRSVTASVNATSDGANGSSAP